MDVFAPAYLPGVGMGDVFSATGLGGLVAVAATSGALVAAGIVGTLIYLAAAIAVLSQKEEFGGRPEFAALALVLVADAPLVHWVLGRPGATREAAPAPGGTAAEGAPASADVGAARSRIAAAARWVAVIVAGASVGLAWAEWNELPLTLGDRESWAGVVIGVVAAVPGAWAARLFIEGSVRVGASEGIVAGAVALVALVLNAAGFYIPFAGYLVLAVAVLFAVRLRGRARRKYKGLRILS